MAPVSRTCFIGIRKGILTIKTATVTSLHTFSRQIFFGKLHYSFMNKNEYFVCKYLPVALSWWCSGSASDS